MNKYLLCVPRGGLNDSFCQIELCREYAQKYNRILYVDTTKSGLHVPFDTLFGFYNGDFYKSFDLNALNFLGSKNVYPEFMTNKLNSYSSHYSDEVGNFVDNDTGCPITFDFTTDYSEDLLIHDQAGGGNESQRLLPHIYFLEPTIDYINKKLNAIPINYISIHVRNTDLLTDYQGYFTSIAEEVIGKYLLICSDSNEVKNYAKSFFANSNVFFVTDIFDINGYPLHLYQNFNEMDKYVNILNALTDLVALSKAEKIYFTHVGRYSFPSGFSRFANFINSNKKILNSLFRNEFYLD